MELLPQTAVPHRAADPDADADVVRGAAPVPQARGTGRARQPEEEGLAGAAQSLQVS